MLRELSILVVDDDLIDQRIIVRALRSAGLESVDAYSRGDEALEHLRAHGFDSTIVLLDQNMPRMSGVELLREIRANRSTRGVPVVMLTSESNDRIKHACYELGAAGFIVKPESTDDYQETAADVVRYWRQCELP